MKFAAFIMTYERSHILEDTINKLFQQTVPPEEILIVDNSATDLTEILIKNLASDKISYYRVGYNSGPAGASKIGLEKLTEKGYDWIYWGDDDDPPSSMDMFEKILAIPQNLPNQKIGFLGYRGCNFNKWTGTMEKILNKDLKPITEVDCIMGNGSIIVNAQVIRDGILPDADWFFSFEDLDFALKMKQKGYKHYITGDIALGIRKTKKRGETQNSMIRLKPHNDQDAFWRDYYSYRNLFIIFLYNQGYIFATLTLIFRGFSRAFLGFFQGFDYGRKNFKYVMLGLLHGLMHKKGYTVKRS